MSASRDTSGLLHGLVLDGQGGASSLSFADLESGVPPNSWIHLDHNAPAARTWLAEKSGLDPLVCEALLAEETRPRCTPFGEGLVLILRGVNLNPGADPEDMVSLRLWVEKDSVVSVRLRRLMAVQDLRQQIESSRGPNTIGGIVVALARGLCERMSPVILDIEDQLDELEDSIIDNPSPDLRLRLLELRRESIGLRRFIGPQRDALARLAIEPANFMSERDRMALREAGDRVTRFVEDLDAARERAAVVQEELSNRLATQMNRTMYVLSVVAGIFLPLGLLTGLLGINVGGMPGAEKSWAFWVVTAALLVLVPLEMWLFRRLNWVQKLPRDD